MYKTINGFTKQSMIDVIKKEFKGQAINKLGTCQYLTDEGGKCAVGCFIPHGHKGQLHSGTVSELMRHFDLSMYMPLENIPMREFQKVHDDGLGSIDDIGVQLNILINWINKNVEE